MAEARSAEEGPEERPERHDLEAARERGPEALEAFLAEVHPADLAGWLAEEPAEEARRVFRALPPERATELLQFAPDDVREEILPALTVSELVGHVERMPADDVVDLLALADARTAEEVLRRVDFERARGLRRLFAFEPETAGGLMTTDFVAVGPDTLVGEAIERIRRERGPAGEEEVGVFVVDEERRPVGHASDRELLTASPSAPIAEVMERDLVLVEADEDQEDVAHKVLKYSKWALPVVDARRRLIGIVTADDVRDVLEGEAEEDILRLVGTSPEVQTRLPVTTRVRHRLPLQALTVVGGLVTAYVLDRALPESSRGSGGDVLRYLPIIIGLAGNVGIQSSTVLVRAFATGEVSQDREASVLGSEVLVGLLIGLLCGGATMAVASYMEGGAAGPAVLFGAAIGGAIALAVTWASLLGCVVPLACRRVGVDPAIVAGPFLITLSDVSGAVIFVAIVRLVLGIGGP